MKVDIRTIESPHGEISLYTLTNASGASVTLSQLGAGVVSVCVPDRDGKLADVVLGYSNPADYMNDGPCAGKVPGRCANRIARGHLDIDGKVYQLAINNGPNHLHGGPTGFANHIWDAEMNGDQVVFTLLSPDGDENYPGNLTARVAYSWDDACTLHISLQAVTDAPTVVNLTNHTYFNLAGEGSGTVLHHLLKLNASRYLPTDDTLIPTGELAPVAGTPMDFTTAHEIGRDIEQDFDALRFGKGYDNCWAIDAEGEGLNTAAVLVDKTSGRRLTVMTDQPGVQIYTGNWLKGCPVGKCGRSYEDYEGVAIECQAFPDAVHHSNFPPVRLNPDEDYRRDIYFAFDVEK